MAGKSSATAEWAGSKCFSWWCQVCAFEPAPCRKSSSSPRSSAGGTPGSVEAPVWK
ncbi:MAG: hypothetical protein U0802_18685 [Candidatus Binatia bacterium]